MKCRILGLLPVDIYARIHLLHIHQQYLAPLHGQSNSTLDAYLRGYTRLLPAPGNEVPMKSNRVIT